MMLSENPTGCRNRTRTCDLLLMGQASLPLLYSAILRSIRQLNRPLASQKGNKHVDTYIFPNYNFNILIRVMCGKCGVFSKIFLLLISRFATLHRFQFYLQLFPMSACPHRLQ